MKPGNPHTLSMHGAKSCRYTNLRDERIDILQAYKLLHALGAAFLFL